MQIKSRVTNSTSVDIHLEQLDENVVAQVTAYDDGFAVFLSHNLQDTEKELFLTTMEMSALFLSVIKLGKLSEVVEPLERVYE